MELCQIGVVSNWSPIGVVSNWSQIGVVILITLTY